MSEQGGTKHPPGLGFQGPFHAQQAPGLVFGGGIPQQHSYNTVLVPGFQVQGFPTSNPLMQSLVHSQLQHHMGALMNGFTPPVGFVGTCGHNLPSALPNTGSTTPADPRLHYLQQKQLPVELRESRGFEGEMIANGPPPLESLKGKERGRSRSFSIEQQYGDYRGRQKKRSAASPRSHSSHSHSSHSHSRSRSRSSSADRPKIAKLESKDADKRSRPLSKGQSRKEKCRPTMPRSAPDPSICHNATAVSATSNAGKFDRPLHALSLQSSRHQEFIFTAAAYAQPVPFPVGNKLFYFPRAAPLLSDVAYIPVDFAGSAIAGPIDVANIQALLHSTPFTLTPAPPRMSLTSLEYLRQRCVSGASSLQCDIVCFGSDRETQDALKKLVACMPQGTGVEAKELLSCIESYCGFHSTAVVTEPENQVASVPHEVSTVDSSDTSQTTRQMDESGSSPEEVEMPVCLLDHPSFSMSTLPCPQGGGLQVKINARCFVSLGCTATLGNTNQGRAGQNGFHICRSLQILMGMRKQANCLLGGAYNCLLDGSFRSVTDSEDPNHGFIARTAQECLETCTSSGLFNCLLRTLERTVRAQTLLEVDDSSAALLGCTKYIRPAETYKGKTYTETIEVTFFFVVRSTPRPQCDDILECYSLRRAGTSLNPSVNSQVAQNYVSAPQSGSYTVDPSSTPIHLCPPPCPADCDDPRIRDLTLSLSVQPYQQILSSNVGSLKIPSTPQLSVSLPLLTVGHERTFELYSAIQMLQAHLCHVFGEVVVMVLLAEMLYADEFARLNLNDSSEPAVAPHTFTGFRLALRSGQSLGDNFNRIHHCVFHIKSQQSRVKKQQTASVAAKAARAIEVEDGEEGNAKDSEIKTEFSSSSTLTFPSPTLEQYGETAKAPSFVSEEEEERFKESFLQSCRYFDVEGERVLRQETLYGILAFRAKTIPLLTCIQRSGLEPVGSLSDILSHSDFLQAARSICDDRENFRYESHFN